MGAAKVTTPAAKDYVRDLIPQGGVRNSGNSGQGLVVIVQHVVRNSGNSGKGLVEAHLVLCGGPFSGGPFGTINSI